MQAASVYCDDLVSALQRERVKSNQLEVSPSLSCILLC